MDGSMLKRFFLALSLVAGLLSPALGAGSISLSLSQQFDSLGRPLNGGLLYFYASGTTTPQSAYQDSALTIPWPNPITLDSAGRVPQLYFADGAIKIRLTNSAGVTQVAADNILVVGASSGSGGGGSVDATTVLATGDLKVKYGTGTLSGFVRANGRTIGSATSGATERANSDTQTLFEYLWAADANLSVSTGRGGSANADWVANKTIALPDWRGRAMAGLDDMGNSAAGRLSATYFGTAATALGAAGGAESKTLLTANLPPYTPSGSVSNGTITLTVSGVPAWGSTTVITTGSSGVSAAGGTVGAISVSQAASSFTGTAAAGQISTPFAVASPMMLATIYVKL
jgi:hypothetical protein